VAFIAAYVGLEVGGDTKGNVVVATLRSNLALGSAMALAFLAIGIGMVIWVRNIMPPSSWRRNGTRWRPPRRTVRRSRRRSSRARRPARSPSVRCCGAR